MDRRTSGMAAAVMAATAMGGAVNQGMASMVSAEQMRVRGQNEWSFHAFVARRSQKRGKCMKPKQRRAAGRA